MSNGIVIVRQLGKFGNQCTQYAFARGYAESIGAEFRCDPWIGRRIFQIEDKGVGNDCPPLKRRSELDLVPGETNVELYGYAQNELAMTYTKDQLCNWFKLRPEIEVGCKAAVIADKADKCVIVCHRRVGDYFGYGYPVVSQRSYLEAMRVHQLPDHRDTTAFLSEEDPTPHQDYLPNDLGFMVDFYRLMTAPIVLRGNSTFSWLAAELNRNCRVFSPVIDGLEGGRQHDVQFVEGNHPRLANLSFTREMRIKT